MSDVHALIGAYAVDALDDDERTAFEHHLADCEPCQAEVVTLFQTGSLLAETSATAPPPALRQRVLGEIASVRPLPPMVSDLEAARERRHGRRRTLATLIAAAAAVVVVGAGGTAVWQDHQDAQQVRLSADQRVLQAPDAQRTTLKMSGGASATVVRSRSLNQAVIITQDMPPAPTDHVYELWLQHGDTMVQAGVLPSDADGRPVLLSGDPASASAVGITVEPDGGSSAPTSDPIATLPFRRA